MIKIQDNFYIGIMPDHFELLKPKYASYEGKPVFKLLGKYSSIEETIMGIKRVKVMKDGRT